MQKVIKEQIIARMREKRSKLTVSIFNSCTFQRIKKTNFFLSISGTSLFSALSTITYRKISTKLVIRE
jgi:hypothetical protein